MIEGINIAGVVHDVGKISVPTEILSKPGKLNDPEFSLIMKHPELGYDILKEIDFPWPIAEIIHQHHERLDGSGYPRGLQGDGILMQARILSVADVIEAMASHRPYRPGLGIENALEEIESKRGTEFDADVVDAALRLFREKGYQLET
jgi:HD-GYP domain-containing protein (c-di-GMP phosphodiesterase class II)